MKTEVGSMKELKEKGGKAFLHDLLKLTSMEISINSASKDFNVPFKHKHLENEEVYIILKGKGVMEVGENLINVKEGSAVKVPAGTPSTIKNTGDEDFQYICIQAKENSLTQFGIKDAEIC